MGLDRGSSSPFAMGSAGLLAATRPTTGSRPPSRCPWGSITPGMRSATWRSSARDASRRAERAGPARKRPPRRAPSHSRVKGRTLRWMARRAPNLIVGVSHRRQGEKGSITCRRHRLRGYGNLMACRLCSLLATPRWRASHASRRFRLLSRKRRPAPAGKPSYQAGRGADCTGVPDLVTVVRSAVTTMTARFRVRLRAQARLPRRPRLHAPCAFCSSALVASSRMPVTGGPAS
jgi:hypothetical protein